MHASHPDSARDLISAFIDGDLDEASAAHLEQWLLVDPSRVQALRDELDFADRLEQTLIPHRALSSFLDGLETRFHAEATADEFLEDLLPRLREVDDRQIARPTKIVRFPAPWLAGLAAAAAVVLAALWGFSPRHQAPTPAQGIAKLAQTSSDIVWAKADGQGNAIEWAVGSSIPAGTSIRLESGTARFDLANGSILTLQGPADVQLESSSEARLVHGNVLASVSPDVAPLTIRAPGMEYQVEGSTTGVRTLDGDKLEAAVLSETGTATAMADRQKGPKDAIGPQEALVTHSQDGLKELVPIDPAFYRSHFNLLAGITGHSPEVSVEMPQRLAPADSPSQVTIALEKEGIETQDPIRVDITPSQPLPLTHARGLSPSNRPSLPTGKKLRSYVIDVGALSPQPDASGYTEAFIAFDKPILGIAATRDTLDRSDLLVGSKLNASASRGLPDSDTVAISEDGRTLRIRLKQGQRDPLASFRVFVQEPEISTPAPAANAAWAAPRVEADETPDLTGKDPDAKPQP